MKKSSNHYQIEIGGQNGSFWLFLLKWLQLLVLSLSRISGIFFHDLDKLILKTLIDDSTQNKISVNMKSKFLNKKWAMLLLIICSAVTTLAQAPYPKTGDMTVCLNATEPYGVVLNTGSTYQCSITPVSGGNGTITAGANANLISVTWTSVGTANLQVIETNAQGCPSNPVVILVTINALPATPVASDQTVCSDGTTTQTLTATATGGTITWYTAATGGTLVTNPTQVGVGTSTYYAQASNGSCSSATRTKVTLTITSALASPTGTNQSVCSDGTTTQTLTATASSPGNTVTWYTAATGGTVVINPTQVGVGTSTYYAQSSNGTCTSPTRTAITLTITAAMAAPTSSDQTVCSDGTTTQTLTATATAPGSTITWYTAATGGTVVTNPTQVGVGTSTYYGQASNGTCTSPSRTKVTLTITTALPAPTASDQTVCSDGTTTQTLTAAATGGTITWYTAATGGTLVTNPTQVGVGTSTYYAQASNGSCTSATRTAVKLTITPKPITSPITHN